MSESPDATTRVDATTAPAPDAPPLVGHALPYARDPLGFVERAVADHGPIVSLNLPRREGLLLADPDAIGRVLVGSADNYRKGEFQRRELAGLLGDGLLISEGRRGSPRGGRFSPRSIPGASPTTRRRSSTAPTTGSGSGTPARRSTCSRRPPRSPSACSARHCSTPTSGTRPKFVTRLGR
ncbi:hypothetical protein SY89_00291 [Halolamina pelagica]|uniref:Cytochrome P450 n=1 Tax=Halolamina pelagica TaxID=699431 RepID=A0A0P7G8H3_9EURY|nr:hypothetical protein [Halolamina pelagica]KPN29577.1 hypothetical protein SY89_00291 [Halolamina pelagica]